MTWLGTIFVGIVTAAIGCVLSGYIAGLAVRWYHVSGFEGGSGYFMLGLALLGLIGGLVVGVVLSRVVAATANPSFFKALGVSVAAIVVAVGVVGGVARLLADVPPTIDGESLMLMVEARYPENETPPPAGIPGTSTIELGSVVRHVQRKSVKGAFWKEDAKLVDGKWIVPGAVYLFTERGDRALDFNLNDSVKAGFIIRLPRRPGKKEMEWSQWYPLDGRGGPTRSTGVTYRTRVQRISEPIRTETLGAFTVSASANGFEYNIADGTNTLDPSARFDVRYNGKPLPLVSANPGRSVRIGMIAQLPSEKPALLAYVDADGETSYCALLVDEGGTLREQKLSDCYNVLQTEELTNDSARFAASKTAKPAKGRIDRYTYAGSSLVLLHNGVLNVKTLAFHPISAQADGLLVPTSAPPMGVSPDQGSFVSYAMANNSEEFPEVLITDFIHNRVYHLPIDKSRMRFGGWENLTPDWLMHHFEWQRGADGTDVLKVRADFVPIPYHGAIETDTEGNISYNIPKGGQPVRMALVTFLEQRFGAKREPTAPDTYEYPMTIEGRKLTVACAGGDGYVLVTMAHGESASDLVKRIGEAFNAELATGKHDAAFVK